MELNNVEIVKKKILDAQEMVKDYEVYSKQIEDKEVSDLFKNYAEECGYQAATLQRVLLNKYSDD